MSLRPDRLDSQASTSDFFARVVGTIDEQQLSISVPLAAEGSSYEVASDEHVLVTFQNQVVDLPFSTFQNVEGYFGSIAVGAIMADEELLITLDRGPGNIDTISTTIPPPFTMSAPATQSGSADLVVTWSPSARDPMSWFGDACEGGFYLEGPIPEDLGALTFPPGAVA